MLAFCRVEVPIFGATGCSFEECQSGCKGGDAFKVVGAGGAVCTKVAEQIIDLDSQWQSSS